MHLILFFCFGLVFVYFIFFFVYFKLIDYHLTREIDLYIAVDTDWKQSISILFFSKHTDTLEIVRVQRHIVLKLISIQSQ